VIPIVTPEEMGAIDAAAPEPVEVLIGRAGSAVAWAAVELLGGTYGRRVTVVAGKGNNGNDGRDAARRLRRRGVRVTELDAAALPSTLPEADLLVDAAYGTGFRGQWSPPPANAPVLAVDIPSGVDGLTGEAHGRPWRAERTVTFAALKPGLVLPPGRGLAGEVTVADIGLNTRGARAQVVEAADVRAWVPTRPLETHKWRAACWVIAGSPGMTGAAHLATRAAYRTGAGYVRLSSPGVDDDPAAPTEAVGHPLPSHGWADEVLGDVERFAALVVGPGLGTAGATAAAVRRVVAEVDRPMVVDGDGLTALGDGVAGITSGRSSPAVLTPHQGEFARLAGKDPGPDRIDDVRTLAAETGAIVLLKGSTTVVAEPSGSVLVSTAGDARLATAGTGDVLSGVIGALLANGVPPHQAAAAGAFVHGQAGHLGWGLGLVASDLLDRLPLVLEEITDAP
jgi:NAD(P)H-hydrate epimerase